MCGDNANPEERRFAPPHFPIWTICKSFLLLFFKKEALSCFACQLSWRSPTARQQNPPPSGGGVVNLKAACDKRIVSRFQYRDATRFESPFFRAPGFHA
jgi:hypothetical protein